MRNPNQAALANGYSEPTHAVSVEITLAMCYTLWFHHRVFREPMTRVTLHTQSFQGSAAMCQSNQ